MLNVLITGGAGFWGRGVLRQVHAGKLDWRVTVYSRDETKQDECRRRYPQARYVLGDIRDLDRLTATAVGHDAIVHAGAMKYIPEAEMNAQECLQVNVWGSQNVVRAALAAGVTRVVGISTDKAVQPVNVYGCSKMAMERLFAEASRMDGSTWFTCVRYGNVVGSTGSVIPLFQRQYKDTGRVQLTDPNMTRFWMGIDQAIELVQLALQSQRPGSIYIPTVWAMRMSEVVLAAVGEVPVDIIGLRPGEKRHESLVHYEESVRVIRHGDCMELVPPGTVGDMTAGAFTLSSQNPHHWMSAEKMKELIEDARNI